MIAPKLTLQDLSPLFTAIRENSNILTPLQEVIKATKAKGLSKLDFLYALKSHGFESSEGFLAWIDNHF